MVLIWCHGRDPRPHERANTCAEERLEPHRLDRFPLDPMSGHAANLLLPNSCLSEPRPLPARLPRPCPSTPPPSLRSSPSPPKPLRLPPFLHRTQQLSRRGKRELARLPDIRFFAPIARPAPALGRRLRFLGQERLGG